MVEACTNGVGCLPDTKNKQAKENHSSLFLPERKKGFMSKHSTLICPIYEGN
jgi:hypothetical protein